MLRIPLKEVPLYVCVCVWRHVCPCVPSECVCTRLGAPSPRCFIRGGVELEPFQLLMHYRQIGPPQIGLFAVD